MEPGGWEELSQSSRRALQFAWAAAQCRIGSEPDGAVVNDWDLLVGILLAHPGTSEAEQTFRHFRLVAGQAFSSEYPRLDSPQLNRALAELPPTGFPETDEFVDGIVRDALSLRSPRSEVSELRSLWVALLQGRGPASEAVRDLLARRGVNPVDLASLSREWLGSGDDRSYDAVLASLPAAPVDVVNYKTDQARRSETHAYDDLIGISAEVDAFAYLLASRSLDPPLAVGLFGAWGSGKSYFLDAIRRRIDQLVAAEAVHAQPQKAVPFWKRIVQVEFNAWHYVEGDLWSSLVDHIFNQLNLASEKLTDNVVEDRQRYLLVQLETTSAGIRELVKRQETIEGDLRDSESRLDELEKQRNDALKAFEAVEARRVAEQGAKSSRTSVLKALRAVKLDRGEGDMTLGTALDTLASARSELERGRALVRPVRHAADVAHCARHCAPDRAAAGRAGAGAPAWLHNRRLAGWCRLASGDPHRRRRAGLTLGSVRTRSDRAGQARGEPRVRPGGRGAPEGDRGGATGRRAEDASARAGAVRKAAEAGRPGADQGRAREAAA